MRDIKIMAMVCLMISAACHASDYGSEKSHSTKGTVQQVRHLPENIVHEIKNLKSDNRYIEGNLFIEPLLVHEVLQENKGVIVQLITQIDKVNLVPDEIYSDHHYTVQYYSEEGVVALCCSKSTM